RRSGRSRHYVYITGISTDFCTVAKSFGSCNHPATLTDQGTAVVSIPSRFRGRARRDAAAFYLSQLAQGILAGEFEAFTGHDTVPIRPTDSFLLEIWVTQRHRVDHVSVRVGCSRRRNARPAPTGRQPGRILSPRSPTAGH